MAIGTRTSLWSLLACALVLTLVLAPDASARLVVGNAKSNKLVGTQKHDEVYGREGKDVLIGFGGWDWLYGEADDDVLLGEEGRDRLWGSGRDDTLGGGVGADRLWPGWGADVVDAGPGNDWIWAGENDVSMDSIDCGDGVDRVVVNRSDRVFNCESIRTLHGRRVTGRTWVGDDTNNVWNDAQGWFRDVLVGLGGNDYLNGHANADTLWGNEGNDTLDGGHSPDLLLGGSDADWLIGYFGNDRLWGGFGLDTLEGRDHDDELFSLEDDGEADVIDCGAGRDWVVVRPNDLVRPGCERMIRIARSR